MGRNRERVKNFYGRKLFRRFESSSSSTPHLMEQIKHRREKPNECRGSPNFTETKKMAHIPKNEDSTVDSRHPMPNNKNETNEEEEKTAKRNGRIHSWARIRAMRSMWRARIHTATERHEGDRRRMQKRFFINKA